MVLPRILNCRLPVLSIEISGSVMEIVLKIGLSFWQLKDKKVLKQLAFLIFERRDFSQLDIL